MRAVITGCLLGVVVASMNIYFGLKTGWSIGGSLIAAILGFSVWFAISNVLGARKFGVLETNITQTSGSAAGSMTSTAGLLSSIPALGMILRQNAEGEAREQAAADGITDTTRITELVEAAQAAAGLSYGELVLWALAVGFLGVFYAVPLRNQLVVVEKLRFPTGTATAETICSMFATGSTALAQARVLLVMGFIAGAFTIMNYFGPYIGKPPVGILADNYIESVGGAENASGVIVLLSTMSAWGFSILISPLMFGAGILIGARVATSLLLGAIVSWAILGPIAKDQGWVAGNIMSYKDGPRGWILWPGVAIMVADALTSLVLSWKTILATFKRGENRDVDAEMEPESERIPNLWWIGGLCAGTVLVSTVALLVFDIPIWMTVVAVAMSWVLAMIAVRSTGETDINPTGGMGKVTQLTFGAVAPGNTTTNLMAAGISSAGASQAGDMMHDLKTGRLLGASPRSQMIAQCIGICAGIPIATAIFKLFDRAYAIGTDEEMPAPAAQAWKAMAELLSGGFDQLPEHAMTAVVYGTLFGILVPVLRKLFKPIAPYLPSSLAFGIAFIVPAYYSVAMFVGAMGFVICPRVAQKMYQGSRPPTEKIW